MADTQTINWVARHNDFRKALSHVPCVVIGADDFEAMRQTYKRNRSGDDDPSCWGRCSRR